MNKPEQHGSTADSALSSKREFFENLGSTLQSHLTENEIDLRKTQIRSFRRLIESVRRETLEGLIKQPPGAGKSRYFAEVIKALRKPAVVLEPTRNLRTQSAETLKEVCKEDADRMYVIEPSGAMSAAKSLQKILDDVHDQHLEFWSVVMTYSSYRSVYQSSPETFEELMELGKVYTSDEAHTSLGPKTKRAIIEGGKENTGAKHAVQEMLFGYVEKYKQVLTEDMERQTGEASGNSSLVFDVLTETLSEKIPELIENIPRETLRRRILRTMRSVKDELLDMLQERECNPLEAIDALQSILGRRMSDSVNQLIRQGAAKHPHLHLRLTATPQLLMKSVQKQYNLPIIDWINIQDMIDDGTLVLPRIQTAGRAIYRTDSSDIKVTKTLMKDLCGNDRFIMEDGRTVIEAVTETYLAEREKQNGYLPAIAFCETIDQAERVRAYLETKGLKAVRCTSGNMQHKRGISPEKAKQLIEKMPGDPDRVDVVATVRQVGMGWDVRTLRGSLWYTFTYSPAVSLQGNGRIMRSLIEGDPWPVKTTDNTVIIEPEWRVTESKFAFWNMEPSGEDKNDKFPGFGKGKDRTLYVAENSLESMIALGEIDPYKVLEKGIVFKRISCDLQNEDHLRLLIGSPGALFENGKPRSLDEMRFRNEHLNWNVSGSRICSHVLGSLHGTEATLMLAHMLWPDAFLKRHTPVAKKEAPDVAVPRQQDAPLVINAENVSSADIANDEVPQGQYKTLLNEYCQRHRLLMPIYNVIAEEGQPHEKTFTVECICPNVRGEEALRSRGKGFSKRAAEYQAARFMIESLPSESASAQPTAIDEVPPEHDYVHMLNTRWQIEKNTRPGLKKPRYQICPKKEGGFAAVCKYGKCTGQGNGATSSIAQQYASEDVLQKISITETNTNITEDARSLVGEGAKFMQMAQQFPRQTLHTYCSQKHITVPSYTSMDIQEEGLQWTVRVEHPKYGEVEVSVRAERQRHSTKTRNAAARALLQKLIELETAKAE